MVMWVDDLNDSLVFFPISRTQVLSAGCFRVTDAVASTVPCDLLMSSFVHMETMIYWNGTPTGPLAVLN